jgi:hypothetical protein
MENSKEGFAYPTASTADSEFAARAGNSNTACPLPVAGGWGDHMPQIPDVTNKMKVLRVAMRNLEKL